MLRELSLHLEGLRLSKVTSMHTLKVEPMRDGWIYVLKSIVSIVQI